MKNILSIAMGAYNCENTLAETLNSLVNQTFTDFTCYICDDGSTDNTRFIIEEYVQKDNRFVLLVNEENKGLSFSLNKCISLSNSKYIARMDGDDIALPNRFEKQISFLEENPQIDFCGSSISYFDNDGIWGKNTYPETPEKKDFLFSNPYAHPTVMYRTESLRKMKASNGTIYSEDKKIGRSEDYDLFMRMKAAGLKSYNIQEPLLLYREDRNAYSKRKIKYAFTDARVRFIGYKKLGLLPIGLLYALKPIVVALIPKGLRLKLHKKQFAVKE